MLHFTKWSKLTVFLCLVIGSSTALAASYADLVAKSDAALKYAADAGRNAIPVPEPQAPYTPSPADQARGFVVYLPPIAQPFLGQRPSADEVGDRVELSAAPGEIESLLVAVYALKAQSKLGWSVSNAAPADIQLEFLPVVMAPIAQRGGNQYQMTGLWLAESGAVDVESGQSRAWVVRIRLDQTARPGDYELRLQLRGAENQVLLTGPTVRLKVLPVKLVDPWERGYVFGAFCAGADFNEAQYREMKAHGIETILWFWGHYGLNVINDNGQLRMDFAQLDATIGRFVKAGLRGPIVLGLGNDASGHFERAICQAFNLPMQPAVSRNGKTVSLAALDNPRIEELMVEALRQLFDHAKAQKWPEIVILPYDEPTERLMNEHRRMVRLFREHFPNVRLYGVTMDRRNWAEMVLDTDILVANGSFEAIAELARQNKKSVWFYGSVTTSMGYSGCRWRYGLRTYAYGPDGMWFWCYNFHPGDPWNDFDTTTPDSSWVICWPPVREGEASVETLAYEGLREAVDDVRYAMTLEARLAQAKGPTADRIKADYAKWREDLKNASPGGTDILRLRTHLIEWIEALSQ